MKRLRKGLSIALIVLAGIALGSVGAYRYHVGHIAQKYHQALHAKTLELHQAFDKIAKTSEGAIYTDPPSFTANATNLHNLQTINEVTLAMLQQYRETAQSLPKLSGAHYFGSYKKATVEHRLALNIIAQTQDVVRNYQQAITYLLALNAAQEVFVQKTNQINAVVIVNTLDPNMVAADAAALQQTADTLNSLPVPPQFQASKRSMVEVTSQTVQGYTDVVAALQTFSEVQLDQAFKIIEAQVARYDSDPSIQPENVFYDSPVVSEIIDLPSKTDLLLSVQ